MIRIMELWQQHREEDIHIWFTQNFSTVEIRNEMRLETITQGFFENGISRFVGRKTTPRVKYEIV